MVVGFTVTEVAVEPVFHRYPLPGGAVRLALAPSQITRSLTTAPELSATVIVAGKELITTAEVDEAEHRPGLVTVTV